MKTKTLLFLIINIILFSCAGPDYTSLPQNIKDAKKDNLLYDIYLPNKKSVMINETEYIINDAFTTTKFKLYGKKDIQD